MTDTPQQTARYYREKAWEVRRSAWHARSAVVRLQLFQIAEGFDRMAAHVEKRPTLPPTRSEPEWAAPPPSHIPVETGEQPCKSPR